MQRNQRDRGHHLKQSYMIAHDVCYGESRRNALRRDDRKVGIDFTGPGGVVLPLTTIPSEVDISKTPRRPWTSGLPIVRPVTGPVLTKVKPKPDPRPRSKQRYTRRTSSSQGGTYSDLMTERSAVCM